MRRLLIVALLLLSLGSLAQAQTTVNLSVTDSPDNQNWNNGTWSVSLQPPAGNLSQTRNFTVLSGGGSVAAQSGSLSASGTASISLPANANIGPSGTVWQFTVCPQASAACFQQSVTVSTSSPQTLAINPPSIRINLATATPPISAYATGEINGAVIGSQFFLLGTGLQICSVVSGNTCSTWGGTGGGITQVSAASTFDLLTPAYGFVPGGQIVGDAVTNGTTTVTSASSTFTAAMNGWSAWVLDTGNCAVSTVAASTHAPVIAGTLTFVSAHNITIGSTNATNSASGQCLAYGPKNDTAASAMDTAMQASLQCPSGALPMGPIFLAASHWTTNPASCRSGSSSLFGGGMDLHGQGAAATYLVPTPDFNWGGCPASGCFGGIFSARIHDFGVNGNNASYTGSPAAPILGNANSGLMYNIYCQNTGGNNAGIFGLTSNGGVVKDSIFDACGGSTQGTISVNSGAGNTFFNVSIQDFVNNGLIIPANGIVQCFGCNIAGGPASASGAASVNNSGTFVESQGFVGTAANQPNFGLGVFNAVSGALDVLTGTLLDAQVNVASQLISQVNGSTTELCNVRFIAAGSSVKLAAVGTGSTFIQTCPNNFGATGILTTVTPTITGTGFGTGTIALASGNNFVEETNFTITPAGSPAATGTIIDTFNTTYTLSGQAPACELQLGNGTEAWTAPVTVLVAASGATTTVYTWAWTAGGAPGTTGTLTGTIRCVPR